MSTYFVDTSSLAKRYLREIGSTWVRGWTKPGAGHVIVISDLTTVEMFSLLQRHVAEKTLSAAHASRLGNGFLVDLEKHYLAVSLDAPVLATARTLVGKYPLRTLDAIQLACALRAVAMLAEGMTFVCADTRLLAAATGEGFTTDNPLAHP